MTELTLKLIIILIPGAFGAIIINRLTMHKEWTTFIYITNSIIIGLFAYLSLQIFENAVTFLKNLFNSNCHLEYKTLEIWNTISKSNIIPYGEILGASLFGVILGFLGSFIDRQKLINKLGRKIKVSDKYGDENLFSYFLNAKETQVVYIRQIKNNFFAPVGVFSPTR